MALFLQAYLDKFFIKVNSVTTYSDLTLMSLHRPS